jgi:hypothetical protein
VSDLTDATLLAALRRAVQYYQVQQVSDFDAYTVDVDAFDADSAITPEPSTQLGTILGYTMAAALGRQQYQGRLRRGEFGISWRSGIEEESSVSAAASYKQLIDGLSRQVTELLLVYHRNAQGARIY